MKNNITIIAALSALMVTQPASADYFSDIFRAQAEHMNRMAAAMEQLEQEMHKNLADTSNATYVTTQAIKYALNKTDKGSELIIDGLKADTIRSHFDETKKELKISSEHSEGNTKINLRLKPYLQQLFLVGRIAQSLETKQESKNDKDEAIASHVMHAESSNGFTENIEQIVNLEEAQVHYNKENHQLRIVLPFMPETPKTKEIPVTVE